MEDQDKKKILLSILALFISMVTFGQSPTESQYDVTVVNTSEYYASYHGCQFDAAIPYLDDISSTCKWQASSRFDWIKVHKTNNVYSFSIAPNIDSVERRGYITISAGKYSADAISVVQYAKLTENQRAESMANQAKDTTFMGSITCVDFDYDYGISGYGKVATIIMPKNGTEIGHYAFASSGLKGRLVIPNGVTAIGEGAFRNCVDLRDELKIPSSVKSIGNYAFENCYHVVNRDKLITYSRGFSPNYDWGYLELNEGLISIGKAAFRYCFDLMTPDGSLLPSTLRHIGDYAFTESQVYNSLVIPGGVKKIGDYAFASCSAINEIVIEQGVEQIGRYAFWDGNVRFGLQIASSVKRIEQGAFAGNRFTCDIVIPSGVNYIGYEAFLSLRSDGKLVLCDGLYVIGSRAFAYSTFADPKVVIPSSVGYIGADAFSRNYDYQKLDIYMTSAYPIQYTDKMMPPDTIYVPFSGVDAYRKADGWKNHKIAGY